jgi:hypothetical protein
VCGCYESVAQDRLVGLDVSTSQVKVGHGPRPYRGPWREESDIPYIPRSAVVLLVDCRNYELRDTSNSQDI